MVLGQCAGSCTFAGMRRPERAAQFLGVAQMLGIFAFQAAKRVIGYIPEPARCPRLHPRPRDCVVLAGRGLSNKEIARALELTPRTVDGYLTEARRERKSVGSGKSVSVRVALGGSRLITKKNQHH